MIKGIVIFTLFMQLLNNSVSSETLEASTAASAFSESDFQIQSESKGVHIKIGDSKDIVEQMLGKPDDYYNHTNFYEYRDMDIHYKDNIVDAIMIDDPPTINFNKYKTPRKVGIGSTYQSVLNQYGKKAFVDYKKGKVSNITYMMRRDQHGQYNLIDSTDTIGTEDWNSIKGISMIFNQQGRVSFLLITNYEFAYYPEYNF